MQLVEHGDRETLAAYEAFVAGHDKAAFTQSLDWTKVKYNWDWEVVLSRDGTGTIRGGMLILLRKVPFFPTALAYAPRGPVCDLYDETVMADLIEGAKAVCQKHHAYLFRMDPTVEDGDRRFVALAKKLGFSFIPDMKDFTTLQIRPNYVLDLDGKTEEDILAGCHSKWRYNIRLAARKGVTCRWYGAEDTAALDDFYALMKVTGLRDGFLIRPKDYFKRMLEAFGPEHCRLYLCHYEGRAVSGAIAVQYGHTTSYVYGASDNYARNVMPNHLMQWEMIRWALKGGSALYDFQGIPGYQDENDPNYGLYRFKRGFGGRVFVYIGQFDLIVRPGMYRLVTLGEHTLRLLKTAKRKAGGMLHGAETPAARVKNERNEG